MCQSWGALAAPATAVRGASSEPSAFLHFKLRVIVLFFQIIFFVTVLEPFRANLCFLEKS